MAYVAALILVVAILFVLYKLLIAPAEATVDVLRGDKIVPPTDPVAVCLFAEDEIQTFTNEQSRVVETETVTGHSLAKKGFSLKTAFRQDGWVIVQATPRTKDWSASGKLHLLVRGAGRPTAVRIVAKTSDGTEHACWHDTVLAGADWAQLTVPFSKLEDEGARGIGSKSIETLNLEIHTDRKLGVKDEEERELVLGGLWISAGR